MCAYREQTFTLTCTHVYIMHVHTCIYHAHICLHTLCTHHTHTYTMHIHTLIYLHIPTLMLHVHTFMPDTHMPAHICVQQAYHAHIYHVHICLYIHTHAPCSQNCFLNCGTLSLKCGDPGEHPPMGSESSPDHLLGWISGMERKVMMVKLVWIWLSDMPLTVFVCAYMP